MPIRNEWHTLGRESAPQAAGVYELGNSNGTIVYIGSSSDIKQRIDQHANALANSCIGRNATWFRYERTTAYISRERELFREYKLTHGGSIPSCNTQDPSA